MRFRMFVFWSLLHLLLLTPPALGSAPDFRAMVEDSWQQQDASRMAQMKAPGRLRFPEGEVDWPGIQDDTQARVPWVSSPLLDGVLKDPCWAQAFRLPVSGEESPAWSLAHDGQRLYVSATFPTDTDSLYAPPAMAGDAFGAIDGIKDGTYGFHTGYEPYPWWQIDLGSIRSLARLVVYNRLDYQPGLHIADALSVFSSQDGQSWIQEYDNQGKHFGGIREPGPLEVDWVQIKGQPIQCRYLRLQIPSKENTFFHLDEVELYGPEDPLKNIALEGKALQSSQSPWSKQGIRRGALAGLGPYVLSLAPGSESASISGPQGGEGRLSREAGNTTLEASFPLDAFQPGSALALQPLGKDPLTFELSGPWHVQWKEPSAPGFGKNLFSADVRMLKDMIEPVAIAIDSVSFTPQALIREHLFDGQLTQSGTVSAEFILSHEGPVAVFLTLKRGATEEQLCRTSFVAPLQETLNRGERLLKEFQIPPPASWHDLVSKAEALDRSCVSQGSNHEVRSSLCQEARWLAREIAFQNPLLDFKSLLFMKRFTQEAYPDVCLNHMPWVSRPGGDLCILSMGSASSDPQVQTLLNGALGPGHVHGMDLSWDGEKIVFGYAKAKSVEPVQGWLDRRTSFDLRRAEEPTHLFEMKVNGTGLRQLTNGEWSDLDPCYLPNQDIAFVSERCGTSLQCNEYDKDETSCNLYVMGPDGQDIRRLSVNKDGDYLPHVLDSGLLGYTRWEYHERSFAFIQSLWVLRPDGTWGDALFKQHMNAPWAVEEVRSIPGSRKLLGIATGHHTLPAGPLILVDVSGGMNDERGIELVTPGIVSPEGGMAGYAVPEGGIPGSLGLVMTPWPLSDRFFLASRTFGAQTDPKGYGLYLMDVFGTQELLYRDLEISCFTPIPLCPRVRPAIVPSTVAPDKPYATCVSSQIGRGVPGIDPKTIRYLRISEPVPWPYDNVTGGQRYEVDAKSVMLNWNPVRVIGTVPVAEDGSVCFQVPVDTAVYFQILDENQMELRRMRSFISFQPGEIRGCVGCHESRAEAPAASAYPAAFRGPAVLPKPPAWGHKPISFLRDVQPILDERCVKCHSGLKPAGHLDFSAGLTARYNRAFDTLFSNNLVSRSNVGDDAQITAPLAFGSHRSKLIEVLRGPKHREHAPLDPEEFVSLATWIDANGPYHDRFINKRPPAVAYDLPSDAALKSNLASIHARRCASCHTPDEITRLDWINLKNPNKSLFLSAPLAREAGGSQRCSLPVYTTQDDPDYQVILKAVSDAVQKAWAFPRRDLVALLEERSGEASGPDSILPPPGSPLRSH